MSDLNLIEAGCESARNSTGIALTVRKGFRKVLRPWLVRLDEILLGVIARLDKAEWHAVVLHQKTDGLVAHLEGLSKDHRALAWKFESRIGRIDAMANSFPGLDVRFDALEDKLKVFHALHWDHVALSRRLAAIEDALAAGSDSARATIEEGGVRPLLPFPGLDTKDTPSSMVS